MTQRNVNKTLKHYPICEHFWVTSDRFLSDRWLFDNKDSHDLTLLTFFVLHWVAEMPLTHFAMSFLSMSFCFSGPFYLLYSFNYQGQRTLIEISTTINVSERFKMLNAVCWQADNVEEIVEFNVQEIKTFLFYCKLQTHIFQIGNDSHNLVATFLSSPTVTSQV